METTASFSKSVKSGINILAILLAVLVLTLPVAIWFWIRRSKGRIALDADGVRVLGLGFGEANWRYEDIERIGVLKRRLPNAGIGGAIAKKMSGGQVAINLCAKMKNGKTRFFMLSRYEGHEQLLKDIETASSLTMEEVKQGLGGPKFVNP